MDIDSIGRLRFDPPRPRARWPFRWAAAFLAVGIATAWLCAAGDSASQGRLDRSGVESAAAYSVVYPLKVSRNGRYLVDQRNVPFMIVGDSPQAMIGDLSLEEADAFLANRKAAGFNALWVDLLCANYTGCQETGRRSTASNRSRPRVISRRRIQRTSSESTR